LYQEQERQQRQYNCDRVTTFSREEKDYIEDRYWRFIKHEIWETEKRIRDKYGDKVRGQSW
jgi:hypothetical protein